MGQQWRKKLKNVEKSFPKLRIAFAIFLFCMILAGAFYLNIAWKGYLTVANKNALNLAESMSSFISAEQINGLDGNASDVDKPDYLRIKNNLVQVKAVNEKIVFAYLFIQKNDKIYFLVDSEKPDSEGYSAPGDEYVEATTMDFQPFIDGKSLLTEPETDRWGTWVTAFVPIKEPNTDKVVAVFGIDYTESQWYGEAKEHIILRAAVILCLIVLSTLIFWLFLTNLALRETSKKLQESEELFRTLFEQAPIGIVIYENSTLPKSLNGMFEKIIGRPKSELCKLPWTEFTHPDDLEEDLRLAEEFKTGTIQNYSQLKRYVHPDNSIIWVKLKVASIMIGGKISNRQICLFEDVTEYVNSEDALKESERSKAMLISNLPGMAYRCKYDSEWTMLFLSEGCYELTGYKAESLLNNKDLSYNDLIFPTYREILVKEWANLLPQKSSLRYEYEIITASGERKWVLELGRGVYENGKVLALEGIVIDISEQKRREERIKYLYEHDLLTGLNNRQHFEDEKKRLCKEDMLPISVMLADINGVRFINESFGEGEGDKIIVDAGKIISKCCRQGDVVARTGGDEFMVLFPNTDKAALNEIIKKIEKKCVNESYMHQKYYIKMSFGYGTKENNDESLDVIIKLAEDEMNKCKLLDHKSYHNSILASMMSTLNVRSQETEEHAERLASITGKIGEKLNLSKKSREELELFAMLHDVGKIAIDDSILNKPGKLSDEEWVAMKKHAEIGYRIASSSTEFESVAEYILYHHERWDGKGYPKGLKKEEIPLLSRIIAIADAYDAMTEDRVYRKALSKEEAIAEIKNNMGTQFDPGIAAIFVEKVLLENDNF